MRGLFSLLIILVLFFGQIKLALPAQAANNFDWKPIPMQSGEIANIVFSPSDPDILYLGVEVNAHSFYKSKDGGKTWKKIDNGDHTKDIAVHPTNPDIAFYADSQSLWRTDSGGEEASVITEHCDPSRQKCASAFKKVIDNQNQAGPSESSFSTIAIAPSNPNIVYSAVRGGSGNPFGNSSGSVLYKSLDGGVTFEKAPANGKPQSLTVIEIDPSDPNHIWIGSESGIFESLDGGGSLTQIARTSMVVGIDAIDSKNLLAASSENGVIKSTDGGKTWVEANQGLPSKKVLRAQFAPSNPQIAWASTYEGAAKSLDGGKTWVDVSSNLKAKNLQALSVHPKNPDIALVATDTFEFSVRNADLSRQGQYYNQGIFRTEDGGKTWARSDQGIIEENLIDITTHPSRPFEVWASQQSSRGLYRSRDAGQTWSLTPHLLTHYPMRLVFFPGDKTGNKIAHTSLHIGEDFGITQDSGVNWDVLSEDTFFDALKAGKKLFDNSNRGRGNLHLHGLAIDPNDTKIIYVGSVDDPSPFNEKPLKGAHIFKSVDGGKTWQEWDDGYNHETATSINDIKIDPKDSKIIYIGTTRKESTQGNGIWKSVDAGQTWQRSDSGMPDSTSVSTLIIHPQKTNELLAATFEGLYRSENSGGTWQQIKQGQFKDIEYDLSNPEIVYTGSGFEGFQGSGPAKGQDGVFRSQDFGKTWENITNNLPTGRVTTVSVNSNGTIAYAGVEGYGLYAAYDDSVGAIAVENKTGNDLGEGRGFANDDNRQYESGRSGGHGAPPFSGGQPPTWFKGIVLGVVGLISLTIVWTIVRKVKSR